MSAKSDQKAAREAVAAYHADKLSGLVSHVTTAIDRFHNGDLDVFEVDKVIFQYSRAAKELWKFCNPPDIDLAADVVRSRPSIDWWERGAPRGR